MYLLMGNDPANENGSMIGGVDQLGNLSFRHTPVEQGSCYDSVFVGSDLVVCGVDPNEGWQLGNIYTKDNLDAWSKVRTLPNTIHAFGACVHNGNLYVATGGHIGDQSSLRGYILKSEDLGQTWVSVEVNDYRTYDVISFGGRLYTIAEEFSFGPDVYTFYQSLDNGDTWLLVDEIVPARLPRMIIWQNQLVVIRDSIGFYLIDVSHNISLAVNPPRLITRKFNVMAVNGDDLFVLCENRVYRTGDMVNWERYCDVPADSISLIAWPGFGLIVSTSGANAQLLRIPFV